MIRRIRGTQDFLDLRFFNFICQTATRHLERFHFFQISTPILEPTELFVRSLGEHTDVVAKEMFTINTGPDGESICLRPEGTAPTVRAFIEAGIDQLPWKVFSIGPMFRHERPQKGRFRQFHQINMEVIGSDSAVGDAYFINMLDELFSQQLRLNSYAVMINFLGCLADRKVFREKLYAFLAEHEDEICATCKIRKDANIMRVYDCKNPTCQELYKSAPEIAQHLCDSCDAQWQEVQSTLELLGVTFAYEPSLVRGLDYYNKTVFEFVSDQLGAQRAFCGGGRYDQLVKELGGKTDQPSFGAAIGIERLLLLLEPIADKLQLPQLPALHVVLPLSEAQQPLAALIAQSLTQHGLVADPLLDGGSAKSMMRKANKMGAAYVLLIGEQEQANNTVTVKQMTTGESETVPQAELVTYLKR